LQAAQKDLRGEAREKSTSGGVHSEYVETRRSSATKHMSLFQQAAKDFLIALGQDVEITVRPTRKEHGQVSIVLA